MSLARLAARKYMEACRFDKYRTHIWSELQDNRGTLSQEAKAELCLDIATVRYEECKRFTLDQYFRRDLSQVLRHADVLEIGCNLGGAALAYYEQYDLNSITGVDIDDELITNCLTLFETRKPRARCRFLKAGGEHLPFPDASFGAVITFDVLEHVENVPRTLRECYRVLRKGGTMLLSFPSFFHITGHHLNNVSLAPCIHWFLPARAIADAYNDMLRRQGKPDGDIRPLREWERLFILNGTTLRSFRKYVKSIPWSSAEQIPLPVGAAGKAAHRIPVLRALKGLFALGVRVPLLEEFCNNRIVFVLTK
jgi:ubiquinone/menaquinone biosynthesis C-methylase UbiE